MLFNSLDFAIFLPIVFLLYWFVFNKSLKQQNILLLVASYVFYGWWDWRFLSLILFSTLVDYTIGRMLGKEERPVKRKLLLWTSLLVNLGLLGFFKYYNFFLDNFVALFSFFGHPINPQGLDIVLPVGISFYTFQTLSYTIDVYRKKLAPTKDFVAFATFVSFFPQLVAGPIERATHLLPQFYRSRKFEYSKAVDGLRQILWGLVKKVIIADNAATFVDHIFAHSSGYSGSTLLLGAVFFAFQIYGDFSGYSDIAIGTSRLFGFDLMQNFAYPYFSRDIAEFWRRWHISLSTWFRDYLYIPLGGSRGNMWQKVRNTFVIFLVSGFWHGANWTFIAWGALNALYFLPLLLLQKNRINTGALAEGKFLPNIKEAFQMAITFGLTVLAWVFFRAKNISHAFSYLKGIFSSSLLTIKGSDFVGSRQMHPFYFMLIILIFLTIEWWGRDGKYALEKLDVIHSWPLRYAIYYSLIIMVFLLGKDAQQFIYFQF